MLRLGIRVLVLNLWWVLQHPDPIGYGLGTEAIVEAAGPECVVPGQVTPVKLLGLKVCFYTFKSSLRFEVYMS